MVMTFKSTPGSRTRGRRVNAEDWNGISRTNESATAIPFGVPAIAGAGDRGCLPLTAAAQTVLGITEANQVLPHIGDVYSQYDTVAICERGVIAVEVGDSVVKNAIARFNVTSGLWTDSVASATVLTIPGAYFDETGGGANAIVAVRYRRLAPSLSAAT